MWRRPWLRWRRDQPHQQPQMCLLPTKLQQHLSGLLYIQLALKMPPFLMHHQAQLWCPMHHQAQLWCPMHHQARMLRNQQVLNRRGDNPWIMTSYVLTLSSCFSEGAVKPAVYEKRLARAKTKRLSTVAGAAPAPSAENGSGRFNLDLSGLPEKDPVAKVWLSTFYHTPTPRVQSVCSCASAALGRSDPLYHLRRVIMSSVVARWGKFPRSRPQEQRRWPRDGAEAVLAR